MANTYKSINTGLLGGSATGTGSPVYEETFLIADWSLSGSEYSISVAATTHESGTEPLVQIEELSGTDYVPVEVYYTKDSAGNIDIIINSDSRFDGRVLIKGQ